MDARAHPAPRTRLADGVPDTTSAAVPAPHWIEGSSSQSQATNCFTGFLEPGVGAHTGFFADPVAGIPQAGAHFTWIHVVVAGPGNPCSGTGVWPDIQLPPGVAWHRQAKIVCFRNGIQVTDAAACPQWSELRVGAGLAARGGELVVLLHAFAGQDTQMATLPSADRVVCPLDLSGSPGHREPAFR